MVYYLNGNWPEAQRAFELTYSNAKDEWLAGEAHEAHALTLRRQSKHDEARAELQDVVGKVKYSGSHASARYDLALTDELAAREAVAGDLRGTEFKTSIIQNCMPNIMRSTRPIAIRAGKFSLAQNSAKPRCTARWAITIRRPSKQAR